MTDMTVSLQSVQDVEGFSASLYSGDKTATAAVGLMGWEGLGRAMGFHLMTTVIEESQSTWAIVFVTRTLTATLEQHLHSPDELTTFLSALLSITARRSSSLNAAAVSALCTLASAAMKRGYRHTASIGAMIGQMAQLIETVNGSAEDSALAAEAVVACRALAGLIDEMGERRLSHVADDVGDAKLFRDGSLRGVLAAAIACVKRTPRGNIPLLKAAVQLLRHALSFDFACTLTRAGDGADERGEMSTNCTVAWGAVVTDRVLLDRLWELYLTTEQHPAGDALPRLDVLVLLGMLTGLEETYFTQAGARLRWLDTILLQSHVAIERGGRFGDSEELLAFVSLLQRVKPSYPVEQLMDSTHFVRWLDSVEALTRRCFEQGAVADSAEAAQTVCVLLRLWARLCGAATSYSTRDVDALLERGSHVLEEYLRCCVRQRADAYASAELARSPSCTGGDDRDAALALSYPLDDDADGLGEELNAAIDLAHALAAGGWRLLANYANAQFQFFEEVCKVVARHGSGAPGYAAAERTQQTTRAAEQASWVLQMAAVCLDSGHSADGGDALGSQILESFLILDLLSRSPGLFDGVPSAVLTHVADAAITFTNAAVGRFALRRNTGRSGVAFLQTIARLLLRCGLIGREEELGEFVVDCMVREVRGTLDSPRVSDAVRARALEWLETTAQAPTAAKMLRDIAARRPWLTTLEPDALPLSLRIVVSTDVRARCRARYHYARCVASIPPAGQKGEATDLLQPALSSLSAFFSNGPSADMEAAVAGAMADIRGVLSCASRRQFVLLYEGIHAVMPTFLRLLTDDTSHVAVATLALQMMVELAYNRGQRIFFGPNSTTSYALFRDVSACVGAVAPPIRDLLAGAPRQAPTAQQSVHGDSADMEDLLWERLELLLRMSSHAIRGGYCNLGVFQLYSDPSLDTMLQSIWGLLARCMYVDLVVRPTVLEATVAFVNELCTDFFLFVWLRADPREVVHMAGLIEATAFPADSTVLPRQPQALETLSRLIACCSNSSSGHDLFTRLLGADGVAFKRMLNTCLEWALVPPSGMTSPQLLLDVLARLLQLLASGDSIEMVRDYFATRCVSPASSEAVVAAFAEAKRACLGLPTGLTSSPGKEAAEKLVAALRAHF